MKGPKRKFDGKEEYEEYNKKQKKKNKNKEKTDIQNEFRDSTQKVGPENRLEYPGVPVKHDAEVKSKKKEEYKEKNKKHKKKHKNEEKNDINDQFTDSTQKEECADRLEYPGIPIKHHGDVVKSKKKKRKSQVSLTEHLTDIQQTNIQLDSQKKPIKKRKKVSKSENTFNMGDSISKEKMAEDTNTLSLLDKGRHFGVEATKTKSESRGKKKKHKSRIILENNATLTENLEEESNLKNGKQTKEAVDAIEERSAQTLGKKKKKHKKKDDKDAKKGEEEQMASVKDQALGYIKLWKDDRKNWKFQKVRQVWILHHMYDKKQVPDRDFETILEYLEGLRGQSKDTTVKKAEEMLPENTDDEDDIQFTRARQVIQLLT